ncbi:MAG: YggS family pyridoxal phosphate enzyme [Meiothermus sp.]|nr:MAG: YggS family pyridoxal phosphate enzyme [Meiothermus sp.]
MSLPAVLERIEKACGRVGRDPKGVRLVAVTKEHSVAEIQEQVLRYGHFALGESRIQEALPKMEALSAEWHFIGPLQRNKAKFAVRFELIHSIDSLRLAETVARKALEQGKVQRVLLELNLGREPQKHGFLEEELPQAMAQIQALEGLRVEGLMTVAPYTDNPETVRPIFALLSRLADRYGLPERSMGMSGDLEVAVEEGATLVRVGRAIFEPGV